MRNAILLILFSLFLASCAKKRTLPVLHNEDIIKVVDHMSDIMIHDVTNPPLAARFFSYATLAGYEVIAQNDGGYKSMYGRLNAYPKISKPDTIEGYSPSLASVLAIVEVARKMQPSGLLLNSFQQEFLDSCKQIGFSEDQIESSIKYSRYISEQIISYAKKDGYNKISNFVRYTPEDKEGKWYPTPPGYFAPVEPYFNTVRSFTLDSCSQFKPVSPVPFSSDNNSQFYQLMLENYKFNESTLTKEQKDIAAFWDCNPFALNDKGHMLVGLKKISPGAHWLGIAGIACKKARVDFAKAMEIHTVLSIGLMDGFICCWDEKYRSNRIRPETAIRKYIDPAWRPLLQTPPFPEYLSGHSTISTISALILTNYFGEDFNYTDSVEVRFGLPAKGFSSFKQAAQEAAISRLYGGIHFKDAIDNGVKQGSRVGGWILNKLAKNNKEKETLANN